MTHSAKIMTVKVLCEFDETATDPVVEAYLRLASYKMLERLYPYNLTKTVDDIPERYDTIQCELAARYFLRQGAQGEKSHDENGVNRTYGSVDDADILNRLTPFTGVVG